MAKKKTGLAGKVIKEEKQLGGGLVMIIFTDGTFITVGQISDVIEAEELGFESAADEDEDEDSEEEEDDSDDEEDDDEEESDDDDDEDDSDDEDEDEDEDDDEEEGDELTVEQLMEMDFDDMDDLVDDEELDIDVDKYEDDEDGLRKAIAKKLGLKLPAAKDKKKKK